MLYFFRKIIFYLLLALLSAGGLFCISRIENNLDRIIEKDHLRYTGSIENAPPLVSFTTMALGGFRGLIADLLWIRAIGLQEKGDYFEMVQLARWMTDLQPNFSGAASYLAWNMAYNISVTCSTPEERWKWVREGIQLLRNRAIVYNPEDPVLYRDLGWIFQHKIGNIMDNANLYYKNALAAELNPLIGSKPDWSAYAAAPDGEKAFLQKYGINEAYLAALQAADIASYRDLWTYFTGHGFTLPEKFLSALPEKEAQNIKIYFKAEALRQIHKLDPVLILEINSKYGNLDWRLPEAQSIYWATMGLNKTPSRRSLDCERMITQALYDAFRSGRLLMIDDSKFEDIVAIPNLNLVDAVHRTYQEAAEANADTAKTFRSAKINFLKSAIALLYNYGRTAKAKEFYRELQKEEPHHLRIPFETFVMSEWVEDIKGASNKHAMDVVSGLLYQSCSFLAYNETDAALNSEKTARFVYAVYQKEFKDVQGRSLPPYAEIKNVVTANCLQAFPPAAAAALRLRLAEEKTKQERNGQ